MALPLPTSLSPSKVSSFKDCALAFRFSAIDRLPEPPSAPAVKGTLVHSALERLFWEVPIGARTLDVALYHLQQARHDLATDPEFVLLGLTDEQEEAFAAEAAELVRKYFELEDPNTVNAIGMELMLEANVGSLKLRGIIDRLDLDADGELVVTDFKTGKVPRQNFEQSKMGGVHFYAFLCEQVLGRRPARVQLLYLSEPVAIIATPTDQSIRFLERQTAAIWKAVEQACEREDFRPRPGRLCDWCSFKSYCPAFGGDPELARRAGALGSPIAPPLLVAAG